MPGGIHSWHCRSWPAMDPLTFTPHWRRPTGVSVVHAPSSQFPWRRPSQHPPEGERRAVPFGLMVLLSAWLSAAGAGPARRRTRNQASAASPGGNTVPAALPAHFRRAVSARRSISMMSWRWRSASSPRRTGSAILPILSVLATRSHRSASPPAKPLLHTQHPEAGAGPWPPSASSVAVRYHLGGA